MLMPCNTNLYTHFKNHEAIIRYFTSLLTLCTIQTCQFQVANTELLKNNWVKIVTATYKRRGILATLIENKSI